MRAAVMSALALIAALAPESRHIFRGRKKKEISRPIGKEMQAAQKAMQAQQWPEALKNLNEAEDKSGITAFDKFEIHGFKGIRRVQAGQVQGGGGRLRGGTCLGQYTPEEAAKTRNLLFRWPLKISNTPKRSSTASKSPIADRKAG